MNLLHRFLLKHFLRILLLSVCAFVGIYLLIDFFEKISDFIDYQASAGDYFLYLANSIPLIFGQILPLAVLMTVVLALGGLGRTNEITAMRSCGISLWRVVQPFMLFALVLSLSLLLLNEFVIPHNAKALNSLLDFKLKGKSQLSLTRDEIWYRDGNRIINVTLAEPQQKKLHGISMFTIDEESRFLQRHEAPSASYQNDSWLTDDLTVLTFDPQYGDLQQTEVSQKQILKIGRIPEDFATSEDRNNELSIRHLSRLASKLEAEGLDATRHKVDLHSRVATPFTCLIMAFLGVPFALQKGRQSNIALGIGLSLGIGVAYFILQSMIVAFGYSGALPPLVAAWAPNLIFLMLGVWLLLSVKE